MKEYLPRSEVNPLLAGAVTIPSNHQVEINQFKEAISKMRGNQNCFYQFKDGGFSSLGEKGTRISLTYDSVEDSMVLGVRVLGGDQYVASAEQTFPGMKPCVIAGDVGVVTRFYQKFIDLDSGIGSDVFRNVQSLLIYYTEDDTNGNTIRVPEFGTSIVNDESNNFENNGWLFTPDGRHLCLFPTNLVFDGDEDGIDNDWFGSGETNSIPNRVDRGELTKCS